MRKLLFICSMFIASQAFTIEGINSNYDNDQVTAKGCKPNNCNTRNLCPNGSTGPRGEKGHRGERGKKGATGATGARGAKGATGISSAPTIIPFASGTSVTLVSASPLNGQTTQAMIGFGANFRIIGLVGDIDISSQFGDTSFTIPRDGEIASISATFNNVSPFELFAGTLTVQANVYVAPEGSNLFAFEDKVVLTPTLTPGPIGPGTLLQGTKPLNITVNNQDRVLIVFSVTNSLNEVIGLQGFANAGLTIK